MAQHSLVAVDEGDGRLGRGGVYETLVVCGQAGGGGLGPKLAGLVEKKYPNIADQEAVIANGRSSMPKFGSRLSPAEINAVARYEREVLGAK